MSNLRAFEKMKQSVHSLKSSFVINLFYWVKMYIAEGTLSLFDFEDWVGSQ